MGQTKPAMSLPHLDVFLSDDSCRNSWVRFPGMKNLYVRQSLYGINSKLVSSIQIANREASKPGNGAFRRLIEHLVFKYPDLAVVVENVHSDLFASILEHMGFDRINFAYLSRHFAINVPKEKEKDDDIQEITEDDQSRKTLSILENSHSFPKKRIYFRKSASIHPSFPLSSSLFATT